MCVELQGAVTLLAMRPCCDTICEHCTSMRQRIGGCLDPLPSSLHILLWFSVLIVQIALCVGSIMGVTAFYCKGALANYAERSTVNETSVFFPLLASR
jgi:hypothetical protein